MSSTTCIAVDSACDLPRSFIDAHEIRILPITLKLADQNFLDTRDPRRTVQLYAGGHLGKNAAAESEPVSAAEISELIEKELVSRYDNVLAIAISSQRSEIYKNLLAAVYGSTPKFKELRKEYGQSANFKIRVIDSQTFFAGQGLLIYEAVRLLKQKQPSLRELAETLEGLRSSILTYLVPDSLYHLKSRASTKGDRSVSWLGYQVGNILDIKPIVEGRDGSTAAVDKVRGFDEGLNNVFGRARAAIEKGLAIKAVNMSYAGDPRQIENTTAYRTFKTFAQDHGVTTLLSVMSSTGAINVGPGAFCLAFAARD